MLSRLKDQALFDLIEENHLFGLIQGNEEILSTLLDLDENRALKMFAENADIVPIGEVLFILNEQDRMKFT